MKRKLSLLMVLMMVLTLIPAMPSFAATDNRVRQVVNTTSDGTVSTDLIIDNTDGDLRQNDSMEIRLGANAEWISSAYPVAVGAAGTLTSTYTGAALTGVLADYDFTGTPVTINIDGTPVTLNNDYSGAATLAAAAGLIAADIDAALPATYAVSAVGSAIEIVKTVPTVANVPNPQADLELVIPTNALLGFSSTTVNAVLTSAGADVLKVEKVSKDTLKVTVLNATPGSGTIFSIPVEVDFDGVAEGNQTLSIERINGGFSGGTFPYATTGSSAVTMRVTEKSKISRSGNQEVNVTLDEISVNSFDAGKEYTLKLPKDFSWSGSNIKGGPATIVSELDRELTIKIGTPSNSVLESVYINAKVVPNRDAKYGDVAVSVTKGEVSPKTLTIAEYVDYVGTVSVEKVLDVVSGKNEDALYVAKVRLEEPVNGTFLQGRFIEFSFNKDVAALQDGATLELDNKSGSAAVSIDKSSSKSLQNGTSTTSTVNGETVVSSVEVDTVVGNSEYSSDKWDLSVLKSSIAGNKSRVELEIPFVVSANFEGDVVLTVQGAGIEKQDLVIAKAKKPVTIEIDKNSSADLKIGVQKQSAPDIIITETQAGALSEDAFYKIANRYKDAGIVWKAAKIEVIEGDLELHDDTDYVSDGIELIVETKSTKASKIKISGVEVTLDRTVPYGPFEVDFNFGEVAKIGSAQNVVHTDLSNRVARIPYFNVVTPAPGDQNATTTFTMDSTTFTMIINGQPQTMTMDVAPFIQDNRAMLPIRFVADAIGAKVNYDPQSRVATFTKDATVAALYLDSNVLYVNGTPVTMDTKPVISNGRAMVPVIYVAQAFGFQYGTDLVYDAATRSVTIFPVAK